ncbi:MAG: cysteine rich repeat-containing protein [Pseudolabrys sp.]|jgi:hypothetical protein
MFSRTLPAAAAILIMGTLPLFAQNDNQQPPSGGMFSGTKQEQQACQPDAVRFCSDAIPDTFKVLDCLKEHREKLHKACEKVLESHGQ